MAATTARATPTFSGFPTRAEYAAKAQQPLSGSHSKGILPIGGFPTRAEYAAKAQQPLSGSLALKAFPLLAATTTHAATYLKRNKHKNAV